MFYYLVNNFGDQEALLFADDLLMAASRSEEIKDIGAIIFLWVALGVPFKWSKFRGGQQAEWIGFWLCLGEFRLGVSEKRAAWMRKWIARVLAEGFVEMRDFTAVLGRICFVMGALEYLRPFTAPLFAWAAAVGHDGRMRIPWSIAFLLSYIGNSLEKEGRATWVRPRGLEVGPAFRADAKAEGQVVAIGGWECLGGCTPGRARWFSVSLDRALAGWASVVESRSGT